jgi:hypothetical protein
MGVAVLDHGTFALGDDGIEGLQCRLCAQHGMRLRQTERDSLQLQRRMACERGAKPSRLRWGMGAWI